MTHLGKSFAHHYDHAKLLKAYFSHAINFYEGNYTDYEAWLKENFGKDVVEPHRLKYKKMS